MKRMVAPLMLGLLLSLSACAPAADKPTATPVPSPTSTAAPSPATTAEPAATPAPAPVWGEQTDTFRQTHPDKPDVVLVEGTFSLPHIENADGVAAYAAINDYYARMLEDLKNDLSETVAQALDDYETAQALGDAFASSSNEQTFEVVYESESTVSVLRTHYGFSSGPYPTLLYMADRFDLSTGAFLKFDQFFTDPARAEELIRAEVVRQGAGQTDYNQDAIASAFNREYFYPTAEGFVFYYQPQILNPQAATKPEFLVPYSLLEGLLSR